MMKQVRNAWRAVDDGEAGFLVAIYPVMVEGRKIDEWMLAYVNGVGIVYMVCCI